MLVRKIEKKKCRYGCIAFIFFLYTFFLFLGTYKEQLLRYAIVTYVQKLGETFAEEHDMYHISNFFLFYISNYIHYIVFSIPFTIFYTSFIKRYHISIDRSQWACWESVERLETVLQKVYRHFIDNLKFPYLSKYWNFVILVKKVIYKEGQNIDRKTYRISNR